MDVRSDTADDLEYHDRCGRAGGLMGLKPFRSIPKDEIEWGKYLKDVPVTAADGSITDATFGNRAAASVIGRADSTAGKPADIVADADRRVLIRRSGELQFDGLEIADLPTSLATDTEVAAADAVVASDAAAALAAHVADSDPHPVYLTQTEGDARYLLGSKVLNGSATYDPPSLADAAGATTTVTVTGAALGDFALASFSLDLQGISVTAYVSATDTVSVRFQNESGGTLDLSSGTLRARVWKQ
jgi:hypothetical protein